MSRLTRDGTAEPVSRDQILRHARGQGNIHFPCSADHEQDWQPYPVDPYSAICDDHTYIHTYIRHRVSPEFIGSRNRTDSVHCRESAGTGPVNLKVVSNGCCLGRSPWTNQYAPLFPTPTIGTKWACWKYRQDDSMYVCMYVYLLNCT